MIKLELSLEEVNLVLAALAKIPLEQSLSTFMKIKTEGEKQVKDMAPAVTTPPEET